MCTICHFREGETDRRLERGEREVEGGNMEIEILALSKVKKYASQAH